jgi:predicted P-loop ATPase
LILTHNGNAKALLVNAITALRSAPDRARVLSFNEFSLEVRQDRLVPWAGAAPGPWSDNEDRLAADWLQHQGIHVSVDVAGQAVQTVARDRRFHPVRNYLDKLHWDGKPRLAHWLSSYLGADDTKYSSAVGARWMLSAVARVYQPGAKADCCLILEGPGSKKSTAWKTLGSEWFADELADLGSKDLAMQIRSVWIVEIAELDSTVRSDISRTKALMSRATDRFRPPYGKQVIQAPRQCIFAGTVNHATYLRDETGGWRFWPVRCHRIDADALERDRDQLWAEAVVQYRAGEVWWLDTPELIEEASRQQSSRYEEDPWQALIGEWVDHPMERTDLDDKPPLSSDEETVCIADILIHCIGKRKDQWTQGDQNRVVRCLQALGFERFQKHKENGAREWRYRRQQ